jgi:glycosyltransferase involved in cell wall biosynthesis
MRITIFDPTTPKPYSLRSLLTEPLGGTEATVIRLAEALNAKVVQHNRKADEGRYIGSIADSDPQTIIVLRDPSVALEVSRSNPKASTILWLHDLAGPATDRGKKLQTLSVELAAFDVQIVCVSDFHATEIRNNFRSNPPSQRPRVTRIYNPVDVSSADRCNDGYDVNKLVFFSSPHKGLDYALSVFSHLHSRNKKLTLFIANPGYLASSKSAANGVVNLGAIPHREILNHVKTALCTFYPNYVYPETFGLAFAESNALGTPVMTHNIGAANEVLSGSGQFIDIPKVRKIADSVYWRWPSIRPFGEAALNLVGASNCYQETLTRWQSGQRPTTAGRPEFLLNNVTADWLNLIDAKLTSQKSKAI